MFHHLENKSLAIILLISFGAMFFVLNFLITDDLKIPQKETLLPINIKSQVNICLAKEEDFDE
ncbi:MAG: hypothetical protein KGP29_02350 [Proteobacteria bacterium]|nr:hypothetical protein [Pseudomonadota bacterium]